MPGNPASKVSTGFSPISDYYYFSLALLSDHMRGEDDERLNVYIDATHHGLCSREISREGGTMMDDDLRATDTNIPHSGSARW